MTIIGHTLDNKNNINENKYCEFNNDNTELQTLNEIQGAEYISMFGTNITYVKLDWMDSEIDNVIGEIINKTYKETYQFRMLQSEKTEFSGDGMVFNRLGIKQKDNMSFYMDIVTLDSSLGRKPMIGDLVLHQVSGKLMAINNIDFDMENSFYTGGKCYMYLLHCKEYSLNNESTVFDTSDDNINDLNLMDSLSINDIEQQISNEEPSVIGIYDDENNMYK